MSFCDYVIFIVLLPEMLANVTPSKCAGPLVYVRAGQDPPCLEDLLHCCLLPTFRRSFGSLSWVVKRQGYKSGSQSMMAFPLGTDWKGEMR